MNKATIGDMIESCTNPNHRGVILYIDEGAFKAYFFVSNRIENFSTLLINQGVFKVVS